MTNIATQIPDALFRQVQSIAEREELTLDQFISIALASQVSVWEAHENFTARAKQGDWNKAQEVLAKAPDREPEDFDALS